MTYYHLADEVDFRLDPDFRPQNNTTMGGDYRPGIFVSGDPYGVSHWCQMYGYWRPWVVEFEGSVNGVEGGYGNEVFIPAEHFGKLRVSRVVPLDAFCRELYQDWGWTEGHYETAFDTEEPIAPHPGGWGRLETPEWKGSYRYPGDARRASSSWRSQYEARIRRYRGEVGGIVSNRRTAASSPGTLYRGLAVPFSEAQLEDVMETYGKDSFVGRVLGYLSRGFFTPNREWGLGKHWTTNINVAKSFSQNGFGTPVVLVAEWDGSGEDPYNAPGNNFGGEDEVTLLPETELRLVDVLWGPTFESIGGSGRTITAGGSLPPGLRFENPKPNQVVAYDDGNPDPWLSRFGVGVLSWDDNGVISWVAIQDDSYKRKGIATAMLEYARTIRSDIRHSDELSESGAGWAQAVGSRTAANDLRVHLFDSEGREMWLEPDLDSNPWTYHPKVMDAVRYLADVAQSNGVYWHMDHNEFIPSTITDFKVFDGQNDVTHEIKEFPQLRGRYASRTAYVSDDIYESYYDTDRLVYLVMNVNVWGTDQPLWELVANSPEESQAFFDSLDEDERRVNVSEVLENGGWTMSAIGRKFSNRTAAEPGGVLPWNPSHRGYTWITKTDGTLEAVTNDGVNRMYLHEYPYGWEWEVFDSLGFVEGGTFGMALKGGDALRDRANDLLAEFDTRAERRTRGPSWGYQDDYTQAPNTLWSKRATTSQRYAERLRREGRR